MSLILNEAQEHRSLEPASLAGRIKRHSPRGRCDVDSLEVDAGRGRCTRGLEEGVLLNIYDSGCENYVSRAIAGQQADTIALMGGSKLAGTSNTER